MSGPYSKLNKSLWQSEKFSTLDAKSRLFYIYCLSSPQANSAGLYRNPIGYMMVDLDWPESEVIEAIDRVSKARLIMYDKKAGTVFIEKWFSYNAPSNPKHAIKIFNDMISIPYGKLLCIGMSRFSAVLKEKGWSLPDDMSKKMDTLSKDPMAMLTPTETQTETYTKKEEEINQPFNSIPASKSVEDKIPIEEKNKAAALPKGVPKIEPEKWTERQLEDYEVHGLKKENPPKFHFRNGMTAEDIPEGYDAREDITNSLYNPPWFRGAVIKLRRNDYLAWQKLTGWSEDYFDDELTNRDEWLQGQNPGIQKSWFVSTANYLKKKLQTPENDF